MLHGLTFAALLLAPLAAGPLAARLYRRWFRPVPLLPHSTTVDAAGGQKGEADA